MGVKTRQERVFGTGFLAPSPIDSSSEISHVQA